MPKLKTHKGASRRFKITGTGKMLRVHGGKSHLRRKKASRVKSLFDKMVPMKPMDAKRIKKLLPYA
jgi:large subunit ribosomal protein L35